MLSAVNPMQPQLVTAQVLSSKESRGIKTLAGGTCSPIVANCDSHETIRSLPILTSGTLNPFHVIGTSPPASSVLPYHGQ